jgi:hypothetical protein
LSPNSKSKSSKQKKHSSRPPTRAPTLWGTQILPSIPFSCGWRERRPLLDSFTVAPSAVCMDSPSRGPFSITIRLPYLPRLLLRAPLVLLELQSPGFPASYPERGLWHWVCSFAPLNNQVELLPLPHPTPSLRQWRYSWSSPPHELASFPLLSAARVDIGVLAPLLQESDRVGSIASMQMPMGCSSDLMLPKI